MAAYLKKLNALAEDGNVVAAQQVFDHIHCRVPQRSLTMLWNTLLKAHANAGDYNGAGGTFAEMVQNSVRPNSKTFGKLMEAAGKGGNIAMAEKWFNASGTLSGGDEVQCNILIDACSKGGDPSRAVAWYKRMEWAGVSPTVQAFGALIDSFGKQGSWTEALSCFQRMREAGFSPDGKAYNMIADSFARQGDVSGILHFFSQVDVGFRDAIFFSSVVRAFGKVGDSVSADSWFNKMREASITPDAVSYSILIDTFAKCGDAARAAQTFQKMMDAGLTPGVICFSTVINAFSKLGTLVVLYSGSMIL